MIYYSEKYYDELSDLVDDLEWEEMKEGDTITAEYCALEPMFTLNAEELMDSLENKWEYRTSEDGDEYDMLLNVLEKNIDYDKINSLIPKLWYPNGKYVEEAKVNIENLDKN